MIVERNTNIVATILPFARFRLKFPGKESASQSFIHHAWNVDVD